MGDIDRIAYDMIAQRTCVQQQSIRLAIRSVGIVVAPQFGKDACRMYHKQRGASLQVSSTCEMLMEFEPIRKLPPYWHIDRVTLLTFLPDRSRRAAFRRPRSLRQRQDTDP